MQIVACPNCQSQNLATAAFCSGCTLYLKPVGSYRLVKPLAKGGFGTVFAGENIRTHYRVAIKVLHDHLSGQINMQKRFQREVDILTKIRHPHVVNIFEAGHIQDLGLYLVMEWLEGITLSQFTERQAGGFLPISTALPLFIQLLEGLQEVHQLDVIHRDLKPQNLMILTHGPQPILKILDFGIAQADMQGPLTQTGGFLGTPHFMAPEQIQGQNNLIGPATDLYAVGLLLYLSLTGQHMFDGGTVQEVCRKQCLEPPVTLQARAPGGQSFPPRLDEVLQKALAKDPHSRFQTAFAFLTALQESVGPPAPMIPLSIADQAPLDSTLDATGDVSASHAPRSTPLPSAAVSAASVPPRPVSTPSVSAAYHPVPTAAPGTNNTMDAPQAVTQGPITQNPISFTGDIVAPQPPGAGYHPRWYVSRPEEEKEALTHLGTPGAPVVLWAPELFGKTWMMKHLLGIFKENQQRAVGISLSRFDEETLSSLDGLLQELATEIVDELDEPFDWVTRAWKRPGNPLRKFTWLMEKRVLPSSEQALLLAIDRIDLVQGRDYGDDFFGMLRSWAEDAYQGSWSRLRLLLAVSTTPTLLTQRSNQSPFNLTPPIFLGDFKETQIRQLAGLYGLNDWGEEEFAKILDLVGGHPYLVRLILHTAASKQTPSQDLLQTQNPIFSSYLNRYRRRLKETPKLEEMMRGIIDQSVANLEPTVYHKLHKAGLITAREGGGYRLRYRLYEQLLDQ